MSKRLTITLSEQDDWIRRREQAAGVSPLPALVQRPAPQTKEERLRAAFAALPPAPTREELLASRAERLDDARRRFVAKEQARERFGWKVLRRQMGVEPEAAK